jgi:hypothetical protein
LIRHRDKFVFHGVLMNVIQPSQVAVLNRQLRVAEIEPNLPAMDAVQLVQIVGGDAVQVVEKLAEIS